MDKRKLAKVPVETATDDMLDIAQRLDGMRHIVTASLIDDNKILLLYFYEVSKLKKGKREAAFRTFLSRDDYITQDLEQSNVKWLTASFYNMRDLDMWESHWNDKTHNFDHKELIYINSNDELHMVLDFFEGYQTDSGRLSPWDRVYKFQEEVMKRRLSAKHKKETDKIDRKMEPIKEVPKEFYDWVWETGMSFSRYVIYKETDKGKAECQCTYCKRIGVVDRKEIRLRNNEKGNCPMCGSPVTFKAKGKLAAQNRDERWFAYVDPQEEGFVFRYFHAVRNLRNEQYIKQCLDKVPVTEYINEYSRAFYTFPKGKPISDSYEWTTYKSSGKTRWCHDEGKICCMECILYPGNLPQAWEHTPMKYSALEVLARNVPTQSARYEDGINRYLEFPKLEWICKMGLNQIAIEIINGRYHGSVGKIKFSGETIYDILGLNKVNTRILQEIDGNDYELRLLQVAQQIGIRFTPEQLREYYETFECNTDLMKATKQKVSLHKMVKYITKESENYPIGERGGCWQYSYMRYTEREDPRIERKRNCAHDWLEYLKWCEALKYDLDNMFIYMPKNFKKVHDRTAQEYQALQDKKAAAEKKRQEALARKRMEKIKKDMEELFEKNGETDAFKIKGNGLVIVVPKSGDEIKAEGEKLHHCVGGYVDRVARGETNIFFVRKSVEPDVPYFTMEFKNNKIIQCRGSHNCGMPPEVEAFVKVFEKKMQEASKENKTEKKHRKVG